MAACKESHRFGRAADALGALDARPGEGSLGVMGSTGGPGPSLAQGHDFGVGVERLIGFVSLPEGGHYLHSELAEGLCDSDTRPVPTPVACGVDQ